MTISVVVIAAIGLIGAPLLMLVGMFFVIQGEWGGLCRLRLGCVRWRVWFMTN